MDCLELMQFLGLLQHKCTRQIRYYLDTCSGCSMCKDACHIYMTKGDYKNLPAYRVDVLRRIINRCFSWSGRLLPSLVGAVDLNDNLLEKMYQAVYTCTGCRRCMVFCPFGIDLTTLINTEKALLALIGKVPEDLDMLADIAIDKGTAVELYRDAVIDQMSMLEPELRKLAGLPEASLPMRASGARILYVSLGSKDSIMVPAAILNLAGESWSLSEFEAANFGYFIGDIDRARQIAARIVNEAVELGVEELVITECGHAYRVMKHLQEAWSGQKHTFKVISVLELWSRYIREGRIRLNENKLSSPLTYHDPCQLGRNGGIFEEPRWLIRQFASGFREMAPNREKNWCCGGGGGLVARSDLEEFRSGIGRLKAEQIRDTGAVIVAAPCGNCRQQLQLLNEKYELNVRIAAVSELLLENIYIA